MTKWIILSNPALCEKCQRVLKTGRGAWWGSGVAICNPCMTKLRGEVPLTAEEKALIAEAQRE